MIGTIIIYLIGCAYSYVLLDDEIRLDPTKEFNLSRYFCIFSWIFVISYYSNNSK